MTLIVSQVLIDDSSDRVISGVQVYDRDNGGTFVVPAGTAFPGSPVGGELFWRTDLSSLHRRDDGNTAWVELSVSAATLDHGLLQGLGDDDHTQYQTEARADAWLGTKDTGDLVEGSNLYYTEGRVSANANVSLNTSHRNTTGNPHATSPGDIGAIPAAEKGVAGGVATLDVGAKIPASQIPAVALPQVFVVANTAARLALTVQEGDEAIQTDDGSHWLYDGSTWFERPGQAVPNDTFNAVDTVGGVSLGGWTDIPLNVVNHETSGSFTFSAPSPDITILNSGVYVIAGYCTTEKSSGSNRSDSEMRLLLDTGSGYAPISGTTVAMYNRNSSQGNSSASVTIALNLPANARVKMQMRVLSGSGIQSRAGGSGITIVSTRGQKGEKGETGSGGNIAVQENGSPTGGPYDVVNFTGDLVSVSDAGGGQANIGIAIPVKNSQEVNGNSVISTTSTTPVLMPGMTLTVASTGNYLLLFSGSVRPYQGTLVTIGVYVNGVLQVATQRQFGSPWFYPGLYLSVSTHALVSLTAGDAVEMRWQTSANDAEATNRTLTLVER